MAADTVLVFKDGRLVEHGSAQTLLEAQSELFRLLRSQLTSNPAPKSTDDPVSIPSQDPHLHMKHHGKHRSERSDSSASKSFRPNAPEFVPHYQRGTQASSGQSSHTHPKSSHQMSHKESSTQSQPLATPVNPDDLQSSKQTQPSATPKNSLERQADNCPTQPSTPKQESKYDGPAERGVDSKKNSRSSRWHRRRQAKSDPPAAGTDQSPTKKDANDDAISIHRKIKGLRHVSGPGKYPSSPRSNVVAGTVMANEAAETPQPRPRRQRHLRIKRQRETTGSNTSLSMDKPYVTGSTTTKSASTLSSSTFAAPSILEEPLLEAESSSNTRRDANA